MANTRRVKRMPVVRDEDLGVDYSRYSDEQQGTITEQQGTNQDLAEEEGVRIVQSFADAEVSRSIQDRPDLQAMFAYLETHPEVGFIIVNELERLTAGISQRAIITELCQRLNITIITDDLGRIDPFDVDKMQEADERAVKAKGEVLKIRKRVRRTLKQRVKSGAIVAMRPAYGTKMKPLIGPDGKELPPGVFQLDEKGRRIRSGVLEIHPGEIEWLREIFRWADLGWKDETIAQTLTRDGVPTKAGNAIWSANSIAGILTNPLYKGDLVWGRFATQRAEDGKKYLELRDEDDPGRVQKASPLGALVDVEMWDRINAKRAASIGQKRMTRRVVPPHLWDNRVFCLSCGHKMYGRLDNQPAKKPRQTPSFRYACTHGSGTRRPRPLKDGFGPPCKPGHTITERQILAALPGFSGDANSPTRPHCRSASTSAVNARRQALLKEIEAAKARFERSKDLYEDGDLSKAALDQRKAKRDETCASAQLQLNALAAETAPTAPPPTYSPTTVDFAELTRLLANEELPIAARIQALDDAGISRLFVRHPVVEVDFL